jgi:ComF family protein
MRLPTLLRLLFELAVSLVAPSRCAACGGAVPLRQVFCAPCARTVVERKPGPELAKAAAVFVYGGAVARALVRFKYDPRPELAAPLADLFRRGRAHLGAFRPDVVVPVPLHPSRLAERGFNQAALLAAPVAKDLGAALLARGLVRTRDTPRQAMLDRTRRLRNVSSAFEARDASLLSGKRVLLVDDVRTTGATLHACEVALRAAGAREVVCLVLAAAEV